AALNTTRTTLSLHDALPILIGSKCGAHTVPYIEVRNPTAHMEHEATTSKVSDDQLFYLMQRGIKEEDAQYMIINGFCKGVFAERSEEHTSELQSRVDLVCRL